MDHYNLPMKKIILGLLAALCLLTACGQKGNLYLPTPSQTSK
jgi:predicted small lipoprotein YifL